MKFIKKWRKTNFRKLLSKKKIFYEVVFSFFFFFYSVHRIMITLVHYIGGKNHSRSINKI